MSTSRKNPKNLTGHYPLTVYKDGRAVIPAQAREQLVDDRVYVGNFPGGTAVVLCPISNWEQWKKMVKREYPALRTPKADRVYFSSFQIKHWDSKGRLAIPTAFLKQVEMYGKTSSGVLVVMGDHFEIWREGKFLKMTTEINKSIYPGGKLSDKRRSGDEPDNEGKDNDDRTQNS